MNKIIVVVYKKPNGRKHYLTVFDGITVEDIIDKKKRKPPLPHDYELIEIGWGEYFIDSYMNQYKIKAITKV